MEGTGQQKPLHLSRYARLAGGGVIAALALPWPAPPATATDAAGSTWRFVDSYETSSRDSGGDRSSPRGSNAVIVRVITERSDGTEMVLDHLPETTPDERARTWQLPARVLQASDGTMRLLDAPAIAARARAWLARGNLTPEAGGRWVFTWTAVQIECDAEAALRIARMIEFGIARPRAGAAYRDIVAREPIVLRAEGAALAGSAPLDPEQVRREEAETAAVLAQLAPDLPRRSPITAVTGTVRVTFAVDAEGRPTRRERVRDSRIERADGSWETDTRRDTLVRTPEPAR